MAAPPAWATVPEWCVWARIWASRVATRVVRASRAAWVTTTRPLKVRALLALTVRGRSAVSAALRQAMEPAPAFGRRTAPLCATATSPRDGCRTASSPYAVAPVVVGYTPIVVPRTCVLNVTPASGAGVYEDWAVCPALPVVVVKVSAYSPPREERGRRPRGEAVLLPAQRRVRPRGRGDRAPHRGGGAGAVPQPHGGGGAGVRVGRYQRTATRYWATVGVKRNPNSRPLGPPFPGAQRGTDAP